MSEKLKRPTVKYVKEDVSPLLNFLFLFSLISFILIPTAISVSKFIPVVLEILKIRGK